MSSRPYQICTNCIMDTSDSKITFDARGWCDYCNNYHANILPNWHPDERGERELAPTIEEIKRHGRGRDARLHHRHERRRRQLLRHVPGEGEVRAAAADLSRRRRLEFAGGGQQHREAGRRARPRPAHRSDRLAGDARPAARVLQGAGAARRHAAGPCFLRGAVQLRREARLQVHPHRRELFDRVRARADRVALPRLGPAPAARHPSPLRRSAAADVPADQRVPLQASTIDT